jgi:CheY-like chemotaxis protein
MKTMELKVNKISWQQLKQIYPLNRLRKDLIEGLMPDLRIKPYRSGEMLFDFNESPDDYFYVIEGSVELSDRQRKAMQPIGPAEEQQAMPMPYLAPSPHRARATTDSRILLVNRAKLLEAMKQNESGPRRSEAGSHWDNLPPDDLSEITQRRAAEKRAAAAPPTRPERILLVEDHPTDAAIAQMMLERLGYRATWVRNFSEAMDALSRERHDVVLLDVQLPGVDGFEATRRIRERWPAASGPRIVALTARALKGDREACLAAGMDDYISKPISIHVLSAKLSSENWALVEAPVIKRFADVIGPSGIVQLIDTFVANWPAMVDEVRGALDQKDALGLRKAAHRLKATADTLGIRVVSGYSLKLEHLGQSGSLDGAPALLGQIDSVQRETASELSRIRAGYAS